MKSPKLIDKWFDKPNKIHNYLYRWENGVRLIVADNPATIEFDLAVVFQAGAYFERKLGVPVGTAHFLEHMLCNPNAEFKTREAIDHYLFGNKSRPSLYKNAATSVKNIYFYLHGNAAGADRMINFLASEIHYPMELFAENIEKEREIILAEWHRQPKPEKDPGTQYARFIVGELHTEFSEALIGDDTSIREITVADLQKYYSHALTASNMVVSVQTAGKPNASLLRKLTKLASDFAPAEPLAKDPEEYTNQFSLKIFNEPKEQSVSMSLNWMTPRRREFDYHEQVLYYLMNNLISKVGHEEYREKLGLVYGVSSFTINITWNWMIRGYKLACDPLKAAEVLNRNVSFWQLCLDFLETSQGRSWFNGQISNYIFPETTEFDSTYAEDAAVDVLRDKYKYLHIKAVSAAKSMRIADVQKHIIDNFQNTPPKLWTMSSLPEAEIDELVKQSDFYKHWLDKPAVRIN